MADFGRVEAHADDATQPRLGRLQGGEGAFLAEMAQEAEDQLRRQAVPLFGGDEAGQQAVGRHGEGYVPGGVCLGVEEHFGVDDAVGRRPRAVGEGEVVEVSLGPQHVGPLVVEVEEVLQAGEAVGGPERLDARERQGDAIPPRQGEQHLRFEAALDVDVQLGLGQADDERVEIHASFLSDVRDNVARATLRPAFGRTSADKCEPHAAIEMASRAGSAKHDRMLQRLLALVAFLALFAAPALAADRPDSRSGWW